MEGSPNWEGTGDGAHNPVTCPPYIRYLCEAGAGEFQADDELKALIRSLGWLTARAGRWAAGVLDVLDCCWVSERWVLGRAWHRAAIGGREGW
eukprot:scaffold11155_cov141-Isochrysis_galbana.AAC.7